MEWYLAFVGLFGFSLGVGAWASEIHWRTRLDAWRERRWVRRAHPSGDL